MNRRDLFKFLAGIGLGAVTIETYERLYHIPMLETMFRKELEYWINQYNIARGEVERLIEQLRKQEDEISGLRGELAKSKEELEHLIQQYNTTKEEINKLSEKLKESKEEINNLKEKVGYWEARYNTTREEVERLNSTINKIDELERESTSAIAYYRERMDEAIRKLKEIIERYRVLLGDERVSFESYTVKVLKDLRLTEERLQKVLQYFPLVLNMSWKPTRVVNDKIYDVNVVFEVISPLSSLEVVEVTLRPVEYKYFITMYGMREEDYNKVFPEEDVRIVRIKPLQTGRMIFSVDFKDLKGGREYAIEVRVRDTAGNEGRAEIKTPYIRQFENFTKTDDILVMASYMPWYTDPKWVAEHNFRGYPLLGAYNVRDPIVIYKHADWATGHGIDAFLMNWNGADKSSDENIKHIMETLENFKGSPKIGILWGPHPQVMAVSEDGKYDMDYLPNKEEFLREMDYLATTFMKNPNYLTTNDGRPIIYFYESKALKGDIPQLILDARKIIKGKTGNNPFIIGNEIGWLFTYPEDWLKIEGNSLTRLLSFDAASDWAGCIDRSKQEYIDNYETYLDILYSRWSSFLRNYSTIFVGSAIPGFDEIYIYYTNDYPAIPKTPNIFKNRLEIAFKYMDPRFKIIRIDTWNDWSEWTNIEPTREELFGYLDVIIEVLRNQTKN
jgi:archaellum component FlaC